MLKLESVYKKYNHRGRTITALDKATFDISEGDYISIVGPSGSGKSTLLLMLGGMLSPSKGRVLLNGQSLYDLSVNERADIRREKIGFVFQTFNLTPYLSILENVQVPLMLSGVGERDQVMTAKSLLDRVGLADRLDHKPSELSVGQQQRAAIARAGACNPSIILADEPTGNLDPDTSNKIKNLFSDFNQEGKTIVIVTHDLNVAKNAKTILRLTEGLILPDIVTD